MRGRPPTLSRNEAKALRRAYKRGAKVPELAEQFEVHGGTVRAIVSGRGAYRSFRSIQRRYIYRVDWSNGKVEDFTSLRESAERTGLDLAHLCNRLGECGNQVDFAARGDRQAFTFSRFTRYGPAA